MNRDEFEASVRLVWSTSRVPLTERNLQLVTGVGQEDLSQLVDELLDLGALDIIPASLQGEIQYCVPNEGRSSSGVRTAKEYVAKRKRIELAKARILARRHGTVPTVKPALPAREKERDVEEEPGRDRYLVIVDRDEEDEDSKTGVASIVGKAAMAATGKALIALDKPLTILDAPRGKAGEKSLAVSAGLSVLGPVGWLYAGSFREAIPASLAYIALAAIVPSFLFTPFLFIGAAASSLAGLTYAWQYNRKKRRTPLFLKSKNNESE